MTPTCRYGHGEMKIVSGKNSPGLYAFPEIEISKDPGSADNQYNIYLTRHQFAFRLYRCPICRYLEMQDEEG